MEEQYGKLLFKNIFKFNNKIKEDATIVNLDYDKNSSIFGVFDGHGGKFNFDYFYALNITDLSFIL